MVDLRLKPGFDRHFLRRWKVFYSIRLASIDFMRTVGAEPLKGIETLLFNQSISIRISDRIFLVKLILRLNNFLVMVVRARNVTWGKIDKIDA